MPHVHAGDVVAVATEAKQPQVFRDDGAFDRRAYLAQQNVDLVATLRASKRMERTAATLLGDRTFVDRSESADFQKTGVFHVLVVAGLHVGAIAVFLFRLGAR